jgi:hypothetical protein
MRFAAFHETLEVHYRAQRNTPAVPNQKIHKSIPNSLRLISVKGEKYEALIFFQFFRASRRYLRPLRFYYSHQHSSYPETSSTFLP